MFRAVTTTLLLQLKLGLWQPKLPLYFPVIQEIDPTGTLTYFQKTIHCQDL
jgi:hypothetical protein